MKKTILCILYPKSLADGGSCKIMQVSRTLQIMTFQPARPQSRVCSLCALSSVTFCFLVENPETPFFSLFFPFRSRYCIQLYIVLCKMRCIKGHLLTSAWAGFKNSESGPKIIFQMKNISYALLRHIDSRLSPQFCPIMDIVYSHFSLFSTFFLNMVIFSDKMRYLSPPSLSSRQGFLKHFTFIPGCDIAVGACLMWTPPHPRL